MKVKGISHNKEHFLWDKLYNSKYNYWECKEKQSSDTLVCFFLTYLNNKDDRV